jgi:hypothetical protein
MGRRFVIESALSVVRWSSNFCAGRMLMETVYLLMILCSSHLMKRHPGEHNGKSENAQDSTS